MSTLKRFGAALALCFCFSLGVSISNRAIADIGSLVQGVVSTNSSGTAVKPIVDGLLDTSNNVQAQHGSVAGVPYSTPTHTDGTPLTTSTGIKTQTTDTVVTGNITGNGQTVSIPCSGLGSVGVDVRGSFTASITVELSWDGTNFNSSLNWLNYNFATINQTISGAGGQFSMSVAGATTFRLRCTAFTSGTAVCTLTGRAAPNSGHLSLTPIIGVGAIGNSNVQTPVAAATVDLTGSTLRSLASDLPTTAASVTGQAYHAVVKNCPEWTGTQANAWNAAAVGINGTSTALDTFGLRRIDAFGNASAATTISLQVSQDNATFYDATATTGVGGNSVVLAGAGNFAISFDVAARYVRLKSSAAATITATIAGKG